MSAVRKNRAAQQRAEAWGTLHAPLDAVQRRTSALTLFEEACHSTVGRALNTLIEPQQLAAQVKTVARSKIECSVAAEVLDLDVGP